MIGLAGASAPPEDWFKPAPTASDLAINKFYQSPLLDPQPLPPVRQRLPADPVVSLPASSTGHYGGTARIVSSDANMLAPPEGLFTIAPDYKTILPNLAQSWTYSSDGRMLRVKLREGLKWSDGHPLTAEDFVFMTQDLQLNPDFQPVPPRNMAGLKLHAEDPRTLVYSFAEPSPLFVNYMAQLPEVFVAPKHYFMQFHPTYTDPKRLSRRLEQLGYVNWSTFIQANLQLRIEASVDQPTLRAFRPVQFTPVLVRYARNPYYFKVDLQGQQLPYIDAIEAEVVNDDALAIVKASQGSLDFAGFRLPTQSIPVLKLAEQAGQIRVLIWRRLHGSDVAIQPNLNYPEQRLRSLFQDARFRRALSVAIDRNEINEIIYFGRGVPRQVTVIPQSDYFEQPFADAYTQYDPDLANRLLDAIGLKDENGDGLREFPDGSSLTITVEYVDTETPKQVTMELVASYWRAIGIDLRLKLIDRGLQYARAISGDMQMSVWHADRTTDILFPVRPDFWVPRVIAASLTLWSDWSRWYLTDGALGEEPPREIVQLQRWSDELRTTLDATRRRELGRKILAVNASQVWSIGTIGLAPHPVVTSPRLKNVIAEGLWGFDTRWTLPYHPETWFLAK